MDAAIPTVDFPLIVHGEGYLQRGERRIPIASITAERTKYRPDLPWQIRLRLGECDHNILDAVLSAPGELPDVEGMAEDGRSLRIKGFDWRKHSGRTLNGTASELALGSETLHATPERLYLTALLTDNPLAQPLAGSLLPKRNGSVVARLSYPPARIKTQLGTADFWAGYVDERIFIGSKNARAERNVPIIQIKLTKRRRGIPLPDIIERLQGELSDMTRLLTLLSRRHVGCFEISATARWRDSAGRSHLHTAELWQEAPEALAETRDNPLVNARQMQPGALDTLYQRFRLSPHKEVIGRVAMYLAEAFHQTYIETQTLYAFTAFEALVNALGEHAPNFVMEKAAFRKLRKRLEGGIKNAAAECGLTVSQVREINNKLGELHRRPFLTRSVEVVNALGINWRDLWPGVDNIETALRSGYSRRSTFVHTGDLENPDASARDVIRFAALSERIVYALLEGDEAWLAPIRWHRMPHDIEAKTS
jgi:hypothetical protein